MRQAIERNIETMIDFLNAIEGDCDLDGGAGDVDCCEAEDQPIYAMANIVTEDDEPSDGTDIDAAWLEAADGHGLLRSVQLEQPA